MDIALGVAISLLVILLISITTVHNVQGTVIAINPDSQITFSNIVVSLPSGVTWSASISCTGSFHFEVGQNITLESATPMFVYTYYQMILIPAGCTIG